MYRYLLLLCILLLSISAAGAVSFTVPPTFEMTLGESVVLTGTADQTTVIYLFMTGPKLNSNGVSLTDIQSLAETGHLITVPVSTDGVWKYTWYTQGISGRSGMVAGTYQIYATDTPLAFRALTGCAECRYDSIEIAVTRPTIQLPTGVASGTLDLRSSTPGITVYLDGAPWGTLPAVLSGVPQGPRIVELRSDSYYSLSKEVAVSAGTTIVNMNPIPFPQKGMIRVNSVPEGMLVYLNGAPVGAITPTEIPSVGTGQQIIDLKPDGYLPWSRTVIVYPGKTEVLTASLTPIGTSVTQMPQTGSLSVTSTPLGAKVEVEGMLKGVTPLSVDSLTPGQTRVTIAQTGYLSWSGDVMIIAGETVNLAPALDPLPQPTPSPLPPLPLIGALLLVSLLLWRK